MTQTDIKLGWLCTQSIRLKHHAVIISSLQILTNFSVFIGMTWFIEVFLLPHCKSVTRQNGGAIIICGIHQWVITIRYHLPRERPFMLHLGFYSLHSQYGANIWTSQQGNGYWLHRDPRKCEYLQISTENWSWNITRRWLRVYVTTRFKSIKENWQFLIPFQLRNLFDSIKMNNMEKTETHRHFLGQEAARQQEVSHSEALSSL